MNLDVKGKRDDGFVTIIGARQYVDPRVVTMLTTQNLQAFVTLRQAS